MAMRVTNTSIYRQYTSAVNDVHSQLNKSMNKISSGKAYENGAENPLAYYSGQRMDTQYQDVLSKKQLLTDIDNRLYEQEQGIRQIQSTLTTGQDNAASRISYIMNTTNNEISATVGTIKEDLIQKQQSMINNLNAKYESFYVFGGNDLSTTPFALSYDTTDNKMILTYNHKFAGAPSATEFQFQMKEDANGEYTFELIKGDIGKLQKAMKEQGRVDIGYGSVHDTKTLIDTYTGGMNVLTDISSDAMATHPANATEIGKALANSAIGVLGQAIITMDKYMDYLDNDRAIVGGNDATDGASSIDKEEFLDKLGNVLDQAQTTSNNLGKAYSSLGSKSSQLDATLTRLEDDKLNLETQYQEKLGADPYEAIMEMYAYNRSYTAALKVSSNIMGMSLFDFMR